VFRNVEVFMIFVWVDGARPTKFRQFSGGPNGIDAGRARKEEILHSSYTFPQGA